MPLLTSVTLSLRAMSLPRDLRELFAAQCRGLLGRPQPLQRVYRRMNDIVWVRGPDALGEDVLDAGDFQHRPDRATRDDSGSLAGRLEKDLAGAELPDDLVRDGRPPERDLEDVLL